MKITTMSDRCILSLWLIIFSSPVLSQNRFQLAIGGNSEEICMKVSLLNNQYHVTGYTKSAGAGSYDICHIRLDTGGNVLHTTIAGNYGEDIPMSGTFIGNNPVITGYTSSFGVEHPFVMMLDTSGDIVWSKYYAANGWGYDIITAKDGNLLMTGNSHVTSDVHILLSKLDTNGNVIWARSYGDSLINEARKVVETVNGNIFICGLTHNQPGGPTDLAVIKTDKNGNLVWSKKYGYSGWDLGYTIVLLGDDLLVGGIAYTDKFNNNPNSEDGLILRIDSNGTLKQSFLVGSSHNDQVRDMVIHPDGKFTATGLTTAPGHGKSDLFVITMDTTATIVEQAVFGGTEFENGISLLKENNELLIGGYTESFGSGQTDMYLASTSATAQNSCNQQVSYLQTMPVSLNVQDGLFATIPVSMTGLPAIFYTSHTHLPQHNLCPTLNTSDVFSVSCLVYPNPATDVINLMFKNGNSNEIKKIMLYSSTGMLMDEIMLAYPADLLPISLQGFPRGVYFFRMITKEGNTGTVSFLKE